MSRLSFFHCCVLCLLLLCSNIESNPGPCIEQCGVCSVPEGSTAIKVSTVDKRWKFPYGTCVRANQRGVQCYVCKLWLHARCVGISSEEYLELQSSNKPWCCPKCLHDALPFFDASNSDSVFVLSP